MNSVSAGGGGKSDFLPSSKVASIPQKQVFPKPPKEEIALKLSPRTLQSYTSRPLAVLPMSYADLCRLHQLPQKGSVGQGFFLQPGAYGEILCGFREYEVGVFGDI